jgi:hypothetical protein
MRIALALAAATLSLTACSSTDAGSNVATPPAAAAAGGAAQPATTPTAAAEPHTEAAVRAAATEEFDSYASGDYGGAWDLFYAPAKKLISRTDYEHFFDLCPDMGNGIRFNIEKIRMDSPTQAHVRASRLIAMLSYEFTYEDGHWRFVPPPENMRDYRTKTVEQVAAEHRAAGACGK